MFKFISAKNQSSIVFLTVALVSILCRVHSVTAQDEPEDESDLEIVDYEDLIVNQPPPVRRCRYNCWRPYRPLCGSDRKTYGNMCHLNSKNRLDNTNIRRVSNGTCPHQRCVPDSHPFTCACRNDCRSDSAHCFNPDRLITCNNVDRPVCGTNGVTYRNACLLSFETACLGYPVRVCHKGPCSPRDDEDETDAVDYDE